MSIGERKQIRVNHQKKPVVRECVVQKLILPKRVFSPPDSAFFGNKSKAGPAKTRPNNLKGAPPPNPKKYFQTDSGPVP